MERSEVKELKDALPMKMADMGQALAAPRTCFQFWYFGVLRLFFGLAQIAAVIWCVVLLLDDGFSSKTMRAAFVAAGITTLSLLLFRIVGRQYDPASRSEASDSTNGDKWKSRGSAKSKD